ncbi:extracellular solute-binding protein, partial [Gammaproteobacteria bacterium]|nr:extracellular solute-binding protein [Gammaproteobacteria bacterium]
MIRQFIYIAAIIQALVITGCSSTPIDEEVNLYSARKEHLIRPLVNIFEKETGIKVNILSAKTKVLIKKIIDQGETSPADLLITVDAGNLHKAKLKNITQEIKSDKLNSLVPEYLRDKQGHWYGLSIRSRVIMYNPETINAEDIMNYENLMDPALKGRVCIRSSSNIYNQSLLASIIHHNGEQAAKKWAKGVVN